MFGQITEFRFFEKTIFCVLGGPILLKHFDLSYGAEVIDFEQANFWQNYPWISQKL